MKYRDILGFSNKKQQKKKIQKPKVNSIVENIKQELNEWNDTTFRNKPKRWSKNTFDTGLTEFEKQGGKDSVNEGPSYEYANYMKKIEKAENNQAKEVNKFVQLLMKKGLKKEATAVASKYARGVAEFDNLLQKIYERLT